MLIADIWLCSEVIARRCFVGKVFLKYRTKFWEKHLCWNLFLIKLQAWRTATVLKYDFSTDVFLWILRNSYEHLFSRTLPLYVYLITRLLSGTLTSTNLGHSTLIYLAPINVACKFSEHWFILTWENQTKLYEDM